MQLKLIFCTTRGWSYPNIGTTRESLTPNSIEAAANHNTEMTCHTVRRSKATTSHHLQLSCHHQVITINVPDVVTHHIGKGSHAQQKSTSAGFVINLGTSQANVSKRNNILTRCTDNPRHTKYR